MSSLADTIVIDQDAIDAKVGALKQECDEKGDEFTKEFITKFGADVKRIITNNLRCMTEAF